MEDTTQASQEAGLDETGAQDASATGGTPVPAPLDATEARIIGSLVEKASTTPESYPLTLNALVAACNQKTSRDPVVQLQPGVVEHALRELEARGLVKVAPASQRALRYEHRFDAVYGVTARQRAVLCVLLLRGAQTPGELLARTQRMADFPGTDEVRDTLERLIQREPPLAVNTGRAAGQRDDRYMHLLSGPVDASDHVHAAAPQRDALADSGGAAGSGIAPQAGHTPQHDVAARTELAQRVDRLEHELATLRAELASLRERLPPH